MARLCCVLFFSVDTKNIEAISGSTQICSDSYCHWAYAGRLGDHHTYASSAIGTGCDSSVYCDYTPHAFDQDYLYHKVSNRLGKSKNIMLSLQDKRNDNAMLFSVGSRQASELR